MQLWTKSRTVEVHRKFIRALSNLIFNPNSQKGQWSTEFFAYFLRVFPDNYAVVAGRGRVPESCSGGREQRREALLPANVQPLRPLPPATRRLLPSSWWRCCCIDQPCAATSDTPEMVNPPPPVPPSSSTPRNPLSPLCRRLRVQHTTPPLNRAHRLIPSLIFRPPVSWPVPLYPLRPLSLSSLKLHHRRGTLIYYISHSVFRLSRLCVPLNLLQRGWTTGGGCFRVARVAPAGDLEFEDRGWKTVKSWFYGRRSWIER